jgi:hypothetical protein
MNRTRDMIHANLTDLLNDDQADADLERMSPDQLREELYRCLGFTTMGVRRAARIFKRLEDLGEDVDKLRVSTARFLRLVANGQMLPEVLVRFAGSSVLMGHIARLPLPDQQRVCQGEPVPLVVFSAGGEVTTLQVMPENLTRAQLRQVFALGVIADLAQQRAYLEDRRTRKTLAGRLEAVEGGTLDRARRTAFLRRGHYTVEQLRGIVRELER